MEKLIKPIEIILSEQVISDWKQSEEKSFRSCGNFMNLNFSKDIKIHPMTILQKEENVLRIENTDELHAIWYSLCLGTFQSKQPNKAKDLFKVLQYYVKTNLPLVYTKWNKLLIA